MLDKAREIALIPTLGFFFSNQSVDNLAYDNGTPNDTSDDGVLLIDDVETRLGHIGVSVAKESLLQQGTVVSRGWWKLYGGVISG